VTSIWSGVDVPATRPDHEDPVVLLVEDDDGDALLVRELMADGLPGARIVWARTLNDAKAQADQADCALLDLGLPDTTGPDGVATLLAAADHLAVVVLTGADSAATVTAALAAGAQDYLVKSRVDGDSLARSIRYALERRKAADSARRLADADRRRRDNARMERALLRPPLVSSADTRVTIRYRPARAGGVLGGDFFDAIEHDDGRLDVVVGDVAGHGADEAALGARLRSAWRALALAGLDPERMLATLESVLRAERDDDSMFVTVCQTTVAADRRTAEVRLAGHPPPFLADGPAVTVVAAASGVLLGPFPGARHPATAIDLPADWQLLLYTDGLIEGRTQPDGAERLGLEAAASILGRLLEQGHEDGALLDGLLTEVELANGEALADDVALCLVHGHARG
jgi:serine phosphatase RsbU (regulator of sigma subunit)